MGRAFTLIEILIVVGILGILAAIVVPKFTDAAGQTTETAVGVGWVWRDDGNGIFDLYATDTTWLAEFAE